LKHGAVGSPEGYKAETGFCEPAQKPHSGEPNEYQSPSRIGRSQESFSYCVKTADGKIVEEGKLRATRQALRAWAEKRTKAWHGAMEATLFGSWI
jgi:hypothetical protein